MATNFASTACPAVPAMGTPAWLYTTTTPPTLATGVPPPTSTPFASSQQGVSDQLNRDFKAADMAQRYGAGGYGIGYGLGLSAGTGLTVAIADGQAMVDGIVEFRSSTQVVVSASSTNWVWLKQDGTIVVQTTTAKPSGNCVLLGAAITDGSGVTGIDTSGVVYWKGGQMWRTCNDLGKPADSPDASLRFFTVTQTGVWFWTGTKYVRLDERGYLAIAMGSDADLTLTADQYAAEILKITSGTLTATRNIVLPVTPAKYSVLNATTGGQSLTFKTPSGTGVTVASGKAAQIFCDGTNIVRLTADATF